MAEFDALGRDVGAAADSAFHTNEGGAVAGAVKDLWTSVGFDKGDNPNHLWTVSFTSDESGFALTASLKDANVYVSPPHPDIPATEAELARSTAETADASSIVTGPAVLEVVPTTAAPTVADPAAATTADTPAAEPVAEEPAPVTADPAHDQAVAAAQDAIAATPNVEDQAAHLAALTADLDAALATWPDSPQLQDAKAQADALAGGTDAPGQAPQ